MGVIYKAAVKIGKACKPTWHRFTPSPTTTPIPSETPKTTPTSTPSISQSTTPTPSISHSTTYSPTPTPSEEINPVIIPTPLPTPSISRTPSIDKPIKKKKSFWDILISFFTSLFK